MEEDRKAETRGKLALGYNSTDNRISTAQTDSTRNSISVINSNMRWALHVARIAQNRKVFRVWLENLKEKGHFEDQGVDEGITLKYILKKYNTRA
jgi:hypothetical protein